MDQLDGVVIDDTGVRQSLQAQRINY